jgi:transposase
VLTAVIAQHTRDVPDVPTRAAAIRTAAGAWARFWQRRLGPTSWPGRIERATALATRSWERLYGEDPLLASLPGLGPVTAPTIRAFLGDGTTLDSPKQVACYVGLTPSNWSPGTVIQPSRAITKEGPAVLRLAFYQAGNAARRVDPQLAALYHRLMVHRGHCHTQATVAVARKLVERT